MKTKEVNEIIRDLYNIDPSLKEYEDKIRDIVLEIYYQKPDIELDDNFKDELKGKIFDRIYELKRDYAKNNTKDINQNNKSKITLIMKKINYILTGAVVTACLFGVFIYFSKYNNSQKSNIIADNLKTVNSTLSITNGTRTFGNLFSQDNLNYSKDEGTSGSVAMAPNAETKQVSSITNTGIGGGSGAINSARMVQVDYTPTIYKYVYNGDKEFLKNLNTSDFPVLKRVIGSNVSFNNSNIIDTNAIDLSKFSNLKIDNMSINEDKDYGYSLYMSLSDGTFSISKNWAKWPQVDYSSQLTINDIPSNEELINIANNFSKSYNINLENYSSPEVQTDYKVLYANTTDKSSFYIPTSTSIIYPLNIDGKEVYEQYGGKYGITMSINFKEKKVEYVNNIQTLHFEGANYDLDNNIDDILTVAENIDNYYYNSDTQAKNVNIELKDPKMAYVRIYSYDNSTNINNEFLVPAIVFKTDKSSDENSYYRDNVVIPLTKDYITQELNRIEELKNTPTNSGSEIQPLMKAAQ